MVGGSNLVHTDCVTPFFLNYSADTKASSEDILVSVLNMYRNSILLFFSVRCRLVMCSPVRVMNRTVRRRSVAVPWGVFPRELSVGQVLSLLWRGHDCRTWAVVWCFQSTRGKRLK